MSDNGIGMDEATRAQACDASFTTPDVRTGMGLGLSVCYTIADRHGGELILESRPGQGTDISFDLAFASNGPVGVG